MPTAVLEPELAAAYVRELSTEVLAVVVLAADGRLLAGPPALAGPARALLDAAPGEPDLLERAGAGAVCAARTASHAVVAVTTARAPAGPTAIDVRTAAAALAPGAPASEAPVPAADASASGGPTDRIRAAEALISAAHSAI